MKVNHSKYHLLLNTSGPSSIQIGGTVINSSQTEKLLGVHFDNKLKIDTHKNKVYWKPSRKLNALGVLTSYKDLRKKRILINAFFCFQFNYCPTIYVS